MEVDKQLKRKISQRWKILAGAQGNAQEAAAYAQLEYIMQEAGLLAKPRKKRHEFGKISSLQGDHTRETSPGDRPAIDDNTESLSEEVGRNYAD